MLKTKYLKATKFLHGDYVVEAFQYWQTMTRFPKWFTNKRFACDAWNRLEFRGDGVLTVNLHYDGTRTVVSSGDWIVEFRTGQWGVLKNERFVGRYEEIDSEFVSGNSRADRWEDNDYYEGCMEAISRSATKSSGAVAPAALGWVISRP